MIPPDSSGPEALRAEADGEVRFDAGSLPSDHPERLATRPPQPSRTARWSTTAAAAARTAASGAAAALRLRRRP